MATIDEINAAYQSQLGRAPDAAGLAYWQNQGNLDGFATGAANEKAITSAYQSSFGRPAEQAGFDYWTQQAAGNANYDYNKAISSGAQNQDVLARNDIAAGGVDTNTTWGNGASLADPNLRYDAENNTWGKVTKPKPLSANVENYDRNPYLSQMATDIQRRSGEAMNLGLQNIRGNAVGVGGLGGSRQGVAEGLALSGANDALQGNLSNLFGADYNNSMNRNMQKYGIDTNASLTNQGQMQNFYTQQRGQDLQGLGLGAQLFGQGNAGYMGQGQGVYNIGNTQQQAPWNVVKNANDGISPYTGYGSSNTATGTSGGGANGMIGGGLAGAQIGKNLGLGGDTNWAAPGQGWGTGNAYGNQDYGSYL